MLSNTLRYGIFADFFGYDVFSVFEVKGILYCCILPYTTDHCEHKKCAHEFCVTEGIGIQQLSGYYSDGIVNF